MGSLTSAQAARAACVTAALLFLVAPVALAGGGVAETRHNLSRTGPGQVRATSETEICVFCHASHLGSTAGPLWNRETSGAVGYEPYQSGTLATRPGQPNGSTVLCLSCHDGTVAVGAVRSRREPIPVGGLAFDRMSGAGGGTLGTNLSGTHPVSVDYATARTRGATNEAATRIKSHPQDVQGRSLLDPANRVQCTTCHDAHEDPASAGLKVPPFWRGDTFDEVCVACHEAPVKDAGHARLDLLPEGCGSCHVGHGVERQPLLAAPEEDACYTCHGTSSSLEAAREAGLVSRSARPAGVEAEFDLPYRHPVAETSRVHDAGEGAPGRQQIRHVECADCHPAHGDTAAPASSRLKARGVWADGTVGGRAEAELCYECHGSQGGLPYGETDKSLEFSPANASYHPVEAPLGKRRVPSLLSPWATGDVMSCGDCHRSDQPDAPAGPHGSRNRWILADRYEAADGVEESSTVYAACYSCHSRTSILSNESFPGHSLHVVDAKESCYACHDSHGSPEYPNLIRFGKDFRFGEIQPSSTGRLDYDPARGGTCYLRCHGVDHAPLGYP